jgi:F-box domain
MKFLHLPYEIRMSIIEALDYQTLLAFSATSRHFRYIVLRENKLLLKHALLDYELSSSAWSTSLSKDEKRTFLPCYGRHKLLLKCHFPSADWYASTARTGPSAFKRRCMTCQCEGKICFTKTSYVLPASLNSGLWVYCSGCGQVTHMVTFANCGIWDHQGPLSYKGFRPEVSRKFRCALCNQGRLESDSSTEGGSKGQLEKLALSDR